VGVIAEGGFDARKAKVSPCLLGLGTSRRASPIKQRLPVTDVGEKSLALEFERWRGSSVAHLVVEGLGEVLCFLVGDCVEKKGRASDSKAFEGKARRARQDRLTLSCCRQTLLEHGAITNDKDIVAHLSIDPRRVKVTINIQPVGSRGERRQRAATATPKTETDD
jgi:hypothetical protein